MRLEESLALDPLTDPPTPSASPARGVAALLVDDDVGPRPPDREPDARRRSAHQVPRLEPLWTCVSPSPVSLLRVDEALTPREPLRAGVTNGNSNNLLHVRVQNHADHPITILRVRGQFREATGKERPLREVRQRVAPVFCPMC